MRYFAFGSNLNRRQFAARCPGSRPVSRATLRGWRLAFRLPAAPPCHVRIPGRPGAAQAGGNGHADIVRQKGGVVHGALYEVTDGDLAALDRYEGAPVYYHRITVFVKDGDGQMHRALAYKMRNDAADELPSLSYALTIVRGCRDWGIEPDGKVRAAMETGLAHTAGRGAEGWPQGS